MSTSPKLHKKLKNTKHATVSLDSMLGLLSSAYGTEELDSNTIFDAHTVNWKNISVENFRTQSKKEEIDGEKSQRKLRFKGSEKISVSTSTSNLKLQRKTGSEIDVTLVSVKSLEVLKQSNNCKTGLEDKVSKNSSSILDEQSKQQSTENLSLDNISSSLSFNGIDNVHHQGGNIDDDDDGGSSIGAVEEQQRATICGFFVDGSNQEVVFDIQFLKKVKNKYLPILEISEPEILINVTDLVKQTKSCVGVAICSITSKCQYFADVDKEFGLENLEVNLKCNLNVFHWIMQWVKADIPMCKPNLCVSTLKDILLIAYHLGIKCLIEECLDFFHHNLKSVLEIDCSIENLFGDNLMLTFVKRFSNTDINEISDEFESFKMKMFCALITLLADKNPCSRVGHYATLATIFQCGSCEKILNHNVMSLVPCTSDCTQLDFKGELNYSHECLALWNLSKYIELMFKAFQSWKLVYWYLWGMCHFLYCIECCAPYPVSQSEWCPYHPKDVEYFPMNPNLYYPIGTHTCCGEKEFKFNVLQPYSGCSFKSHTLDLKSKEGKDIHSVYERNKHFISCKPPENVKKKFVKLLKKSEDDRILCNEVAAENFWWHGIQIAPKVKRDYSIISLDILNQLRSKPPLTKITTPKHNPLTFKRQIHLGIMPSCPLIAEEKLDPEESSCPVQCNNNKMKLTVSKPKVSNATLIRNRVKKKKASSCVYLQPSESSWANSQTNKDNQDNQRDFEEVAMRRLVKMLSSASAGFTPEPSAGTYIRLEADWLQEHFGDTKFSGNSNFKNSGTVVNRTFPLAWFRRLAL